MYKNNKLKSASLAGVSILLINGSVAIAQQTQKSSGFVLEEITVTARKVEENLQDTPVSVSAFTGDGLERRQIFSTDDLDNITPNLQFSNNAPLAGNNSSSQVFIRGIGQTDPTSTVDPGVGIYIDDVYMGQSVGGTMDFRDIASVQVLRGPQGTLFGRNTIGGAILLTTTEPGDELGGSIKAGIGSDNLREVFAALDLPITENLRSRHTFGKRLQDGYVTRVFTGEDLGDTNSFTITGKFVWTPVDRLNVKFQYDYTKADENGSPLVFAASNESATFQRVASAQAGCPGFDPDFEPFPFLSLPAVPLIDDERCANDFWNEGEYSNSGTFPIESKLWNWGTSVVVNYDLNEEISLKSVTAYRDLDWTGKRDADNTPFPILHTAYDSDGSQFSQELQLLYTAERLTGVAGLYYFEEEVDDIVVVELSVPPFPAGRLDSDSNKTDNSSWAVFTQWSYDFTEALALTLGVRYSEDTKGSTPDQFSYTDPAAKYLEVKLYEETFDAVTAHANVSYRFDDSTMVYASYSEGYKGGGWNSHFNGPTTPAFLALAQKFDEETAESWELGFKSDLLDNSVRVNGAVFTTDYTDLQFTYRAGVAPFLANAGEASIDGFELELTYVPSDAWIIEGGIGYLDATIDSLTSIVATDPSIPAIATGVKEGNRLPYAPQWQGNIGVGYTFDVEAGIGLNVTPRADLTYQDETFFDAINTTQIAQNDTVTLLNVSVAFETFDGAWKVVAGINNATDETYPIAGNSSLGTGSGYAEIAYSRAREYFVNLEHEF